MKIIRRLIDWWLDGRAAEKLTEQYWKATGHPAQFTRAEGRAFRTSGMTAHTWLLKN